MIITQALKLEKGLKVLEVGAGSGYQAAIIALANQAKVYAAEIISELADFARKKTSKGGSKNVEVISSFGSFGYSKMAPYNRIVVSAACPEIPTPLVEH